MANAIQGLRNIVRGLPLYLARQTVSTYIYGSALYVVEIWWHSTDVWGYKRAAKLLDKCFKTAARAIAPAYKTIPIPALLREAGLPPAKIHFETIRRRAAARHSCLDSDHPLAQRIFTPSSAKSTSLTRLAALAPPATERADPILFPP